MTLADHCEAEIHDLHEFIEGWLGGHVLQTEEVYDRAHATLAENFEVISPSSERRPRATLLDEMWEAYGVHADSDPPLEIRIREVRHRYTANDLCLVTYEEWQRVDGEETGRISSALFRRAAETPNGVEWVHLHETWC